MKSPGRFLALSAYTLTTHRVVITKVGELDAPESTRLDIDDVFNGESLCILDYIMGAFEGGFDEPEYMLIVVKAGARLTSNGWICDYDKTAKASMLNDVGNRKEDSTNATEQQVNDKPYDDAMLPAKIKNADGFLTDFVEEFNEIATSVWGESRKAESLSEGGDSPDAENLRNTFMISEDDRKDRTKVMKTPIDDSKYVAYASKWLHQMTARWRDREMREHRAKHMEAVKVLKTMPNANAMHARRTSNVSKHTLPECLKRAQEWQNWHSARS